MASVTGPLGSGTFSPPMYGAQAYSRFAQRSRRRRRPHDQGRHMRRPVLRRGQPTLCPSADRLGSRLRAGRDQRAELLGGAVRQQHGRARRRRRTGNHRLRPVPAPVLDRRQLRAAQRDGRLERQDPHHDRDLPLATAEARRPHRGRRLLQPGRLDPLRRPDRTGPAGRGVHRGARTGRFRLARLCVSRTQHEGAARRRRLRRPGQRRQWRAVQGDRRPGRPDRGKDHHGAGLERAGAQGVRRRAGLP